VPGERFRGPFGVQVRDHQLYPLHHAAAPLPGRHR
jgi:hypothetical protein